MALHPREGGRKHPLGIGDSRMNRRTFLRNTGLTAASIPLASAILAACTKNTGTQVGGEGGQVLQNPARPDNPVTLPTEGNPTIADGLKPEAGPLELYNWEEYINPRIINMFEEQYGVKVNVNTFNTEQESLATLTTASDINYDVFFPTTNILSKLAVTKILMPLNKTYLTNLANVWSVYQGTEANSPFYDVGAQYTVPYTVYTTGVAWRIDQPRGSAIKGPSADYVPSLDNPYDVMWDPKWKGKTHILDDYREVIGMILLKNGVYDVNTDDSSTRTQNLATAQQQLVDLVNAVDVKADVNDYTDMPDGASLVHQAWSGDMVSAQYYFPKYQENKDVIRYWAPTENMMIGQDFMSVLNTGSNPVLAHHFLNFMLDFDSKDNSGNSMVNFQWNGYIPPMKGVVKEDLIKGAGPWQTGRVVQPSLETCIPTEEDFTVGHQLLELTPEVDSQWKDAWETFQTTG